MLDAKEIPEAIPAIRLAKISGADFESGQETGIGARRSPLRRHPLLRPKRAHRSDGERRRRRTRLNQLAGVPAPHRLAPAQDLHVTYLPRLSSTTQSANS